MRVGGNPLGSEARGGTRRYVLLEILMACLWLLRGWRTSMDRTRSRPRVRLSLYPHPQSAASLPTYVMTTRIVTVVPALIFVGYSYKQNAEDMKYLWSSKLRKHTVHSEDAAGAIWACAE